MKHNQTNINRTGFSLWLGRGLLAFMLSCSSLWVLSTQESVAGNVQIKDETNAKIARIKLDQKLKRNSAHRKSRILTDDQLKQEQSPSQSNKTGCGSNDIGNVNNGVGRRKQNVEVIVIGDVINGVGDC